MIDRIRKPLRAGIIAAVVAFSVIAGVGMGAATFGVGAFLWFVPFINPSALDMGLGGAIAGFVTGLIAGPPKWFSN